jgi:hypothetical protein
LAKEEAIQAIEDVIKNLMDRVMVKVLTTDPFISDVHKAQKPLYAALVPDEIFKGSHFERRFTTPFGGVWEKLAVAVANKVLGFGTTSYPIVGTVNNERLRRISEILNGLEHAENGKNRIRPNWEEEISYILAGEGEAIPVTVICDVFIEDTKRNLKYAFELKAPLPNSDQTKVSKEKIFKLLAMDPVQVNGAYYALPYNPYGEKKNYAWSFPGRWFDMKNDAVVLIGDEFWDFIGGAGTYQMFVQELNKLGQEYKERIYREYLGIEPPVQSNESLYPLK